MEHLPIVIFEIVLSVFIAFAVFARILIKQITDYQKQIKKLEADLEQIKNRSTADPQYVDEWFRFKKMF